MEDSDSPALPPFHASTLPYSHTHQDPAPKMVVGIATIELTIPEKDVSVEVTPKMAATSATPDQNSTKVLAFVGNSNVVAVTWTPPAGKIEKGKPIVIASQAADKMAFLVEHHCLRLHQFGVDADHVFGLRRRRGFWCSLSLLLAKCVRSEDYETRDEEKQSSRKTGFGCEHRVHHPDIWRTPSA